MYKSNTNFNLYKTFYDVAMCGSISKAATINYTSQPAISRSIKTLEQELNTKNYKILNNSEIRLYDYLENSSKVNKTLIKNDIDVISLYEAGITLEDYFKSIIKEEA